jgi:hypothetical protein
MKKCKILQFRMTNLRKRLNLLNAKGAVYKNTELVNLLVMYYCMQGK